MKWFQTGLAVTLPLCASPTLLAGEDTDPAAWVPADAIFYFGVTDLDKTWADFKKTAVYGELNDSKAGGAASSAKMFKKMADRFKERLADALEMEADQLKNPFGGAVALYVTAPSGGTFEDVTSGLVAGIGDHDLMKKYYAAAVRKLKETADDYESVSAGSNTIDVFTSESEEGEEEEEDDFGDFDDEGLPMSEDEIAKFVEEILDSFFSGDAMPERLALCLTDERLIVAESPEKVKSVLRQERSGESLLDSEQHKALARHFKALGPVRMVANLPRILEMALATDDKEKKERIAMLGLKSLRGLVAHLSIADEAYDFKTEAMLLMSGERTGLAKILSMKNREVAPPKSVSADAAFFASVNVKLLAVLDEVEKMIRRTDPEAADQMRARLEQTPMGPGAEPLNLRKEFLEHLREPLSGSMTFARPYNAESVRLLVSLGHRNREAMEKLFGLISELQPGMFVQRDLRGNQVYDIPMIGISVSVAGDAILIGTTKRLESALGAASEDGLAANASFRKAAKLAPSEAWGIFYMDSRRMMEAAIGFLENEDELGDAGMMNAGAALAMLMAESIRGEFDADGADQARALLKYQAPSLATLTTEPDGIRYVGIRLKPEKR